MRSLGAKMLPVCSATPSCSSLCPVSFHGGTRALLQPMRKVFEDRHLDFVQDNALLHDLPWKSHPVSSVDPLIAEGFDRLSPLDSLILSPYRSEIDDIVRGFSSERLGSETDTSCCLLGGADLLHPSANYVINLDVSATAAVSDTSSFLDVAGSSSTFDGAERTLSEASAPTSIPMEGSDAGVEDSVSSFVNSVGRSVFQAEDALTETYDKLRLSTYQAIGNLRKSIDGTFGGLLSSVDGTKKQAAGGLTGLSTGLQEKANGVGALATESLRQGLFTIEQLLAKAGAFVVSSYGSAKSSLPPNVKDLLNVSEDKATQIFGPIGNALHQVYIVVEGIEKNLGLDPNDPIVQVLVVLGSSAAMGVTYWLFIYGGYSGDLAPEITLGLLKNDKNAVLIDVRPEARDYFDMKDLRERDGIPDLRRGARSKYTSVTVPEVTSSTKKMLKGGRDFDDALIALVIRNLKIIKGESKVIVMDANGTRSKAIARSLKKLGVKRPYMVKGGFQSWQKNVRVKELKPETALSVLNEDAEEILESVKPTPALVLGYSLGLAIATYALLEWEKTLQYIGVAGIGATIYLRFTSYNDAEDLKKDVGLLLAPVKVGAQAVSWAARKIEPNKLGLPTSPSTTAVHNRVLQAAAKHESQPSDAEENRGSSSQPNENVASSEA